MDPGLFFEQLIKKEKKIAVVGLGYVGLPLLIELSKHFDLIGFDIGKERIGQLKNHFDKDNNVEKSDLANLDCKLTSDDKDLKEASFFIIAVPTPIDIHKNPDMSLLKEASEITGKNIPKDSIIVYESTVYPGVTEDMCVPILEKNSKLKNKKDFFVGYSPERINPGDKLHTLKSIKKVVSAQDRDSLEIVSKVYRQIIDAGIFEASSIKVAEAAKAIENTQRDLNIALINELSIIFSKLGIDTSEVLEAASTKWNFLKFYPGLVGGHCIGVDPYYLTYKAKEVGYNPEVILAGRRINDNMGFFFAREILKNLMKYSGIRPELKVVLFGMTFKENVSDIRNSRVIDIYNYLVEHNIKVCVYDPVADKKEVLDHYGIELIEFDKIKDADAFIFCVAHDDFKRLDLETLKSVNGISEPIIFDIKWIFNREDIEKLGFYYWRI